MKEKINTEEVSAYLKMLKEINEESKRGDSKHSNKPSDN